MKANNILIGCSILALITQGCIANKAVGTFTPIFGDANGRIQVENAQFQRKLNFLAVSTMGLSTLGGGYLGYESNLTGTYQDGERVTLPGANAAIGALTGFGISYGVNLGLKGSTTYQSIESEADVRKWVNKKIGAGYTIVRYNNGYHRFLVIPKKQERAFVFRQKSDFHDFYDAFAGSPSFGSSLNAGMGRSIGQLGWSDLKWAYSEFSSRMYWTPSIASRIEDELFTKSSSIGQYGETARLSSRYKEQCRDKAYSKCRNIADYAEFRNYFSEWSDKASTAALSLVRDYSTASEFKRRFGDDKALLTHVKSRLSAGDLKKLAALYELSCQTLSSSGSYWYIIPPDSYGVVTLKDIPSSNISLNARDETGRSLYKSADYTLIDEFEWQGVFNYSFAIFSPSPYARVVQFQPSFTSYERKYLEFCIHFVEDNMEERLLDAGINLGIDEGIGMIPNEDLRNVAKGAKAIYDIWQDASKGRNPIKAALIKGLAGVIAEELNITIVGEIAADAFADMLIDFVKYAP